MGRIQSTKHALMGQKVATKLMYKYKKYGKTKIGTFGRFSSLPNTVWTNEKYLRAKNVTFRTRVEIGLCFAQHLASLMNLFANCFLHLFFPLIGQVQLGRRLLQGPFHAQQFALQFVVLLRDFDRFLTAVFIG